MQDSTPVRGLRHEGRGPRDSAGRQGLCSTPVARWVASSCDRDPLSRFARPVSGACVCLLTKKQTFLNVILVKMECSDCANSVIRHTRKIRDARPIWGIGRRYGPKDNAVGKNNVQLASAVVPSYLPCPSPPAHRVPGSLRLSVFIHRMWEKLTPLPKLLLTDSHDIFWPFYRVLVRNLKKCESITMFC